MQEILYAGKRWDVSCREEDDEYCITRFIVSENALKKDLTLLSVYHNILQKNMFNIYPIIIQMSKREFMLNSI